MNLAERAAMLLVPKPFQEFLSYVSPSALRVIHKDRVLGLALEIVNRGMSRGEFDEAFSTLQGSLRDANLEVDVVAKLTESLDSISDADRKTAGEKILELYFHMIHSEVPLDLDLRPSRFGWDAKNRRLLWSPSRLRHRRSEEFHSRVIDLYRGFFSDDREAAKRGIELYRWESRPDGEFDERMETLLRLHFGDVRSGPIRFEMSHFKHTFHLSFEEAIRSRSRFHPELTFLGTTLAGLYVTLDQLGETLDVESAYRRVFERDA